MNNKKWTLIIDEADYDTGMTTKQAKKALIEAYDDRYGLDVSNSDLTVTDRSIEVNYPARGENRADWTCCVLDD